jgi:hypothetical protein
MVLSTEAKIELAAVLVACVPGFLFLIRALLRCRRWRRQLHVRALNQGEKDEILFILSVLFFSSLTGIIITIIAGIDRDAVDLEALTNQAVPGPVHFTSTARPEAEVVYEEVSQPLKD